MRSGVSQAQRQPRMVQQDDAIHKWRMVLRWCSWRTPPLPNAGSRMHSTGIVLQDHVSDGTAGSEPFLAVVEAPAVLVVVVVKLQLQQQRELRIGAEGWRYGQ